MSVGPMATLEKLLGENDKEMPQLQAADQPTVPCGRYIEHRKPHHN